MSKRLHIKDITLGPSARNSGHEAYLRAVYNPPKNVSPAYRIIYKKNKHGLPELSRLEVMFSQLARLFLFSDLTSCASLVVDAEDNVCGLAVKHLCYVIAHKELGQQNFYTFNNPQAGCEYTSVQVTEAAATPIYFFDKVPQGFFAKMAHAEKDGLLTFDYESLASAFATSFFMEEDDFHKGNFGFYLVEREGKPHVVFFKIDHDLMFADSIMGFFTRRYAHFIHGAHAFDITCPDVRSLSCLENSLNAYWPTKYNYIYNPFQKNKYYHSNAEIHAFASLSINPHFIKAKWKSFFKHILIPHELIGHTLKECVNMDKASDRASVALITQVTVARLARLRAVLFSLPEFCDYVARLNEEETQNLLTDITQTIPQDSATQALTGEIRHTILHYQTVCKSTYKRDVLDTPLHTAIKLGDYRYEETLNMFGQFINVRNEAGQTPLDLALETHAQNEEKVTDMGKDSCSIMRHLLENGAQRTLNYQRANIDPLINTYPFKNPYLARISAGMHYTQFKDILRDIGEDHRLSLKSKKISATECIKHFIKINASHPRCKYSVSRLRDDINGYSSEEDSAGVKYIRQLRSRLWIIRQFRGLYGLTSTQREINHLIDHAKKRIETKQPELLSLSPGNNRVFGSNETKWDLNSMDQPLYSVKQMHNPP